jgi:hypothetical protein
MTITSFTLCTFILMILSLGMVLLRYTSKSHDSNWPSVYYSLTLGHLQIFEGGLYPNLVYAGFVCGALLRFEFMSGWFLSMIEYIEYGVLLFMAWRCFDLVFFMR